MNKTFNMDNNQKTEDENKNNADRNNISINQLSNISLINQDKDNLDSNQAILEEEKSSTTQNPSLAFQNKLQEIISTQEAILQMTFSAKEKLHSGNEITLDQINTFKQKTKKYGIYLSLIKNELQTISETIRKIKKLKK